MQVDLNSKVAFIRHAESLSNKAVHDFQKKHQLPYCWTIFRSMNDFNENIVFNPDLCDCSISEMGEQQAIQAKKEQRIKQLKPDLIIVSPLQRALQTCDILFGDRIESGENIKVVVQPIFTEKLKHSSDLSREISVKQKKYPKYDFEPVKKLGDMWFIKNESQENQAKYFQHLQAFSHCTHEQKLKHISKFMYAQHLRESTENVRKRADLAKEIILKYSEKYSKIIVISHFFTIKHIMSKEIDNAGEPLEDFHGGNCSINEATLKQLKQQVKIINNNKNQKNQ